VLTSPHLRKDGSGTSYQEGRKGARSAGLLAKHKQGSKPAHKNDI